MSFSPDNPARVLLAIDHPGWAYHNIASQLVTHLGSMGEPLAFRIVIGGEVQNEACDLLVCFNWGDLAKITGNNRVAKSVICLYDSVTWTRDDFASYMVKLAIEESTVVAVANQGIADALRYRHLDTRPVFVVEDGVDCGTFPPTNMPAQFAAGWAGNSQAGHGELKGLDIIREACESINVPLMQADLGGDRPIPHHRMTGWYSTISCYVCASKAEGTPNPVLEAAASGKPVVSTRCGIVERVITDGINGFIVDRDAESIAAGIKKVMGSKIVDMSAMARVAAEQHDWCHKIHAWRTCIRGALTC